MCGHRSTGPNVRWLADHGLLFGAGVSLATRWVLVSRLERVGERFGLTEALLGTGGTVAADAPGTTASVTAVVHHQAAVGAGVTIGLNVFNLAARSAAGKQPIVKCLVSYPSSGSTPTVADPASDEVYRFQTEPAWKDNLLFSEYFHGDNGAEVGYRSSSAAASPRSTPFSHGRA
jgi:hypothetical protein